MTETKVSAEELYGVRYFHTNSPTIFESDDNQLYSFKTYIGKHTIDVEKGDCVYYFSEDLKTAFVKKGVCTIKSNHCATIIRGYMHPDASMSMQGTTLLPYVNGCSTKQIFPPLRLGDPTLQFLNIPAFSKEQEHHIHSTVRVVLVISGKGKSVVGLEDRNFVSDLYPGVVSIFDPMSPHHFETPDGGEPLIVAPLHIYSSIANMEQNHPMFNGTIMVK